LGGGEKEPGIRVSSEALFLLGKIKRVYLGLGRGLGLEDTLFFLCPRKTRTTLTARHCKTLQDIAKLIGKHLYNYEPHTAKPPH